jgi:hypothetical protein
MDKKGLARFYLISRCGQLYFYVAQHRIEVGIY